MAAPKQPPPRLEELPDMVEVPLVAAWLSVSINSAYLAVRRGEIPSVRIGRRLLVPRGALQRLMDGCRE